MTEETKLRVRTVRLIEVIDAVQSNLRLSSPSTTVDACDAAVKAAFASLGEEQGCGRKLFNRDVVYGHGYRGQSAVREFATDLHAAFNGRMGPLLKRVREADQEAVVTTIQGLVTTRGWLDERIANGLLQRLSFKVHQRFPLETRDEIRGVVHLALAVWAAEGSFDAHLRRGYQPSLTNMTDWIGLKVINVLRRRGQDALLREMRGSRTDREFKADGKIAADALDVTSFDVVKDYDEDGVPTGETMIVDRSTDEDSGIDPEFLELARDCLKAARSKAHDRLLRVLDLMCVGASRQEIADQEGITILRAGHLTARVRGDLREAVVTLDMARAILRYIVAEPFATRGEIIEDLGYSRVQVDRAVRLLGTRGMLAVHTGHSYRATDAGLSGEESLRLTFGMPSERHGVIVHEGSWGSGT